MKVGVSLPQSAELDLASLGAFVDAVDRAGLDSLWVGDHLVFPTRLPRERYPYIAGMHDEARLFPGLHWSEAIVTLAAAAALAPRLDLGSAVLLPVLRHPLVLAKQLASLDALSGGRLIVGFGVGWLREEYRALGAGFADRIDRLVELMAILRLLWSGEPVAYEGRYWTFDEVIARPRPAQGTSLRIWYGGNNLALLERLAPEVEGWLPYEPSVELLQRGREVAATARGRAGKSASFTLAAVCRLPLTDAGALAEARAVLGGYQAAGIEHLAVLSSVGRSADENLQRAARLAGLVAR